MNSFYLFNYRVGTSISMQIPLVCQLGCINSLNNAFCNLCHRNLKVGCHDPELQWMQRNTRCQSKARFVCLFGGKRGDASSKDAARRALENALGGKKDAFERWDEEIKKKEAARGAGGGGGRGWFGDRGWFGGSEDGGSWKEIQQSLFAIAGLIFVYLVLVKGKPMMAFAMNSLLFLLRGFRSGFRSISSIGSRTSFPSSSNSSSKSVNGAPASAQANVIKKWGPE